MAWFQVLVIQIMEYSLKDITSAGVAQGSNFLVNTYTTGNQREPSIAIDNNGNFIISWMVSWYWRNYRLWSIMLKDITSLDFSRF
jgi:hypothetical protein